MLSGLPSVIGGTPGLVTDVISGMTGKYEKFCVGAETAKSPLSEFVTVIVPLKLAHGLPRGGVRATMREPVTEMTNNCTATAPDPISTVSGPSKPVPSMVISVPPVAGPAIG